MHTPVLLETGEGPELQFILFGLNEAFSATFGTLEFSFETIFQKSETVSFERSILRAVEKAQVAVLERIGAKLCVYVARRGITLSSGNEQFHLSSAIVSVITQKYLVQAHFYPHDEQAPKMFDHRIANVRAAVAQVLPVGRGTDSERVYAQSVFLAVERGFLLSDQMMTGEGQRMALSN